jgi:hypothetical protein
MVAGCSHLDIIGGQCLVVQTLSGPIEGDGMMVALADVDADGHIDRAMFLVLLHRRLCRLNGLARNISG